MVLAIVIATMLMVAMSSLTSGGGNVTMKVRVLNTQGQATKNMYYWVRIDGALYSYGVLQLH